MLWPEAMKAAVKVNTLLPAGVTASATELLPEYPWWSIALHWCWGTALACLLSTSVVFLVSGRFSASIVVAALLVGIAAGGFTAARRVLALVVETLRALRQLALRTSSALVQQLAARVGSVATTPIPVHQLDESLQAWSNALLEAHRGRKASLKITLWLTGRLSHQLMRRIREAIFVHSRLAGKNRDLTLADVEVALRESSVHIIYGKVAAPFHVLRVLCTSCYIVTVGLGVLVAWISGQVMS